LLFLSLVQPSIAPTKTTRTTIPMMTFFFIGLLL
jgi:hypothetical protein